MEDDDEDRETTVEEYQEQQGEAFVEILKEFYNGLLADLDAGKVIIADGKITKAAEPAPEVEDPEAEGAEDAETPDEGWSYEPQQAFSNG